MQLQEIPFQVAIEQAPKVSKQLMALAAQHRVKHSQTNQHQTLRHWEGYAGTFVYQTHIAIANQPRERLDWLSEIFFNAATLTSQPWYPQFLDGKAESLERPCAAGIAKHHLTLGRFDLGLPKSRCYRQLVSLAQPDENTRVIVARSVPQGPQIPDGAELAYTLDPNGEVLHFEGTRLHWHHICCTPGAGLLPGRLDRWLINTLRIAGLDQVERKTYREEAHQLHEWLSDSTTEMPFSAVSSE